MASSRETSVEVAALAFPLGPDQSSWTRVQLASAAIILESAWDNNDAERIRSCLLRMGMDIAEMRSRGMFEPQATDDDCTFRYGDVLVVLLRRCAWRMELAEAHAKDHKLLAQAGVIEVMDDSPP